MNNTPTWYLILQVIANFAIVGTFIIYWRQLVAMRGQLLAMREQQNAALEISKGQNLITLIEYMQQPTCREDRKTLIELGKNKKPFNSWSKEEIASAERVCVAYNLAGIYVKQK